MGHYQLRLIVQIKVNNEKNCAKLSTFVVIVYRPGGSEFEYLGVHILCPLLSSNIETEWISV